MAENPKSSGRRANGREESTEEDSGDPVGHVAASNSPIRGGVSRGVEISDFFFRQR